MSGLKSNRSASNLGLRTCRVSRPSGIRFCWASTRSSRRSTASPRPRGDGYPPYNIERLARTEHDPERLRITLAVAGFTRDQLDVTLEENQLVIRGRQTDDKTRHFLHRGIAARQFQRAFLLADGMEVLGADLSNGLCRSIWPVRSRSGSSARSTSSPRTRRDDAPQRRRS